MAFLPVKFKCHIYLEEVTSERVITQAFFQNVEFLLDLANGSLLTKLPSLATEKAILKVEVVGKNNEVEVFSSPTESVATADFPAFWTYYSPEGARLIVEKF